MKHLYLLFVLFSAISINSFGQSDDCSSATDITAGTACVSTAGDLRNRAATTVGTNSRRDVWYKVTVPLNTRSITIAVTLNSTAQLTNTTTYIEMLQANVCPPTGTTRGGLQNITLPRTYTGLTPGNTYLFRIATTHANTTDGGVNDYKFNVCVTHTENDNCLDFTVLTSGYECVTAPGSLYNRSTSTVTGTTCSSLRDVWYRVNVPSSSKSLNISVNLENPGQLSTTNTFVEMLNGTNCGSSASLGCQNISSTRTITGLTPGNYYFRIGTTHANTTDGTPDDYKFNVCVTYNENDFCTEPSAITVGGSCVGGNLKNKANTNVTGANSCGNMRDVWYQFTMPAGETSLAANVTLNNANQLSTITTFVELLNGNNCPATGTSLGCYNIALQRRWSGLTPGATYLMRVSTSHPTATAGGTNDQKFSLCLTYTNDECQRAVPITQGAAPIDGTVHGGSPSAGIPVDCAAGTPDDDVWFSFVPTLSYGAVSLTSIGSDLANNGARLQIFSGTCGGTFVSRACGLNTVSFTGFIPGDTYYCRVYSASAGQSTGSDWNFKIMLTPVAPSIVTAGRMREVYRQQNISSDNGLLDPWEVTYGPDDKLWVTEAKGYRVYRVNPADGGRSMVLDVSQNSRFLPPAEQFNNCQFNNGNGAQGGFAGLALHPKFLASSGAINYVYVSYVHTRIDGQNFVNRIMRFTFDPVTERLGSPKVITDSLPGSNDHNSQRMIIAPVDGIDYLFYASGDMGAGQFANKDRQLRAQLPGSVEGKILRFNLDEDGDIDAYDRWIPSTGTGSTTNPYNASLGKQSPVWAIGIRNNQGFAYDKILDKLYGSSHGPYSDDEINVIERARNYGHPLVIGYAADGNVNGTTAGASMFSSNPLERHPSSCPVISDEAAAAAAIPNYKDPLFSAYPNSPAFPSIYTDIWAKNGTPGNGAWPSEGWSGLDLYTHTLVPGWSKSLVAASLKWGRLVRVRLNAAGTTTAPTNTYLDTVSYFGSRNRFRDLAFAPNGKDVYVVMDKSTTSSGPSSANPIVPNCLGCLQKYSFLGYEDSSGRSLISTEIDVANGASNACTPGTTITIDQSNYDYWVPITGPDGNILAEINSNSQILGTITSSFYKNTGAIRMKNGASYADRNITITPQIQPSGTVNVRLYLSKAEYDALDLNPLSGITSLADVRVLKNADPCQSAIVAGGLTLTPVYAEAHGGNGYVLQVAINGFSSFYFGSVNLLLPVNNIQFNGKYNNGVTNLKWETTNELHTGSFEIERSNGNGIFEKIGKVSAKGGASSKTDYIFNDEDAAKQGVAKLYYRLKVIDTDGAYAYTNVLVVDLPGALVTRVNIFPNPADKQTTVKISSAFEQQVTLKLADVTGRIVNTKTVQVRKGENRIQLDLAKFRTGVYFLQINGQYINAKEKIQKL